VNQTLLVQLVVSNFTDWSFPFISIFNLTFISTVQPFLTSSLKFIILMEFHSPASVMYMYIHMICVFEWAPISWQKLYCCEISWNTSIVSVSPFQCLNGNGVNYISPVFILKDWGRLWKSVYSWYHLPLFKPFILQILNEQSSNLVPMP